MSKFTLSKAMGNIPDDMLQEAMEVKKKSRTGWTIFRAAACLAVVVGLVFAAFGGGSGVVTGPGILAVTVYAADETPHTISSPDMVLHKSIYWDVASSASIGCPITLSVSDKYDNLNEITFQVAIDGGGMMTEVENEETGFTPGATYQFMSPQFSVPNDTTIYWTTVHPNTDSEAYQMVNRDAAYVKIIIYNGDIIIGYSVLQLRKMSCSEVIDANPEWILTSEHMECTGEHKINCYRVEMLESVYFPKIEGKHQTVEEEYVCKEIEKAKQR